LPIECFTPTFVVIPNAARNLDSLRVSVLPGYRSVASLGGVTIVIWDGSRSIRMPVVPQRGVATVSSIRDRLARTHGPQRSVW